MVRGTDNRGLNGVLTGNKWGNQGKFNKGTIYTVGGVKETRHSTVEGGDLVWEKGVEEGAVSRTWKVTLREVVTLL